MGNHPPGVRDRKKLPFRRTWPEGEFRFWGGVKPSSVRGSGQIHIDGLVAGEGRIAQQILRARRRVEVEMPGWPLIKSSSIRAASMTSWTRRSVIKQQLQSGH